MISDQSSHLVWSGYEILLSVSDLISKISFSFTLLASYKMKAILMMYAFRTHDCQQIHFRVTNQVNCVVWKANFRTFTVVGNKIAFSITMFI